MNPGSVARLITDYMRLPQRPIEPIMTNSENITDFFANAYRKPATASASCGRPSSVANSITLSRILPPLGISSIPPADFFRTMEDASGVDLDWFWRGWFYTTDAVDISLDSINWYKWTPKMIRKRKDTTATIAKREKPFDDISKIHNREEGMEFQIDKDPASAIFIPITGLEYGRFLVQMPVKLYEETYSEQEKKELFADNNYYELFFSNQEGWSCPSFSNGRLRTAALK